MQSRSHTLEEGGPTDRTRIHSRHKERPRRREWEKKNSSRQVECNTSEPSEHRKGNKQTRGGIRRKLCKSQFAAWMLNVGPLSTLSSPATYAAI